VYVPAGTPVTVTVKSRDYSDYSPDVSYDVPGKPGNSIVTQNVSLPCRQPEPPDDAVFTVEKASISYIIDGQNMILTFDSFGKRIRWDTDYGTEDHSVIIFDDLAQVYTVSSDGAWIDMPYTGGYAEALFSVFIYRGDMYAGIPGFSTLPNETIAGKSCSVIGYTDGECYVKMAGWNGLLMLTEDCNGVSLAVTAVSLKVPQNAFTKTVNVF
jgi:hypothetical protein